MPHGHGGGGMGGMGGMGGGMGGMGGMDYDVSIDSAADEWWRR